MVGAAFDLGKDLPDCQPNCSFDQPVALFQIVMLVLTGFLHQYLVCEFKIDLLPHEDEKVKHFALEFLVGE
jgi:hypothetical protein